MPRLYRPHIPLKIRVAVAEQQLVRRAMPLSVDLESYPRKPLSSRLAVLLADLVELLGCEVSDLRLDHDPPLAARPQRRAGLGRTKYVPDANDPNHLNYRPHGPEFDGSHLIKTNVRGDHGQHPDRVLIKKARRLERGPKPKRGPKMQGRSFIKSTNKLTAKVKWAKRPFPKRRKP